ncbi:MAG: molybdopterin-dependent oxidoreductase [Pseudomonadota bacterium]
MAALSKPVGDQVKCTTCYMCACRCGIKVHLKNGQVKYIEGNRAHPVNKGVLCAKGASGIMQHLSPARLQAPMRRIGPRGSGEFKEISWEEALSTATKWLGDVRDKNPNKLAFFTGRDQSQSLTGWWARQFGTANFAAHGGFCSVNMAAAGLYSFGGSFWEFGEPDWDLTEYFMLWGVAEDHASNPLKKALGKLKKRGVKIVAINPVRTGYGAIADEWIGLKPGTDGLFAGALIYELLRTKNIDIDYLTRYSNAHWLVIQNPGKENDGLFARDEQGNPLAFDGQKKRLCRADELDVQFGLSDVVTLKNKQKAVSVLKLIAERFLSPEYSPQKVADIIDIEAETICRLARELAEAAFKREIKLDVAWTDYAGRKHQHMVGRPVSMHAMRGISAHSNGFQTCRTIHLLQILLGSIDCPGGFRYKPPYPKEIPPPDKPAGRLGEVKANQALSNIPLGFVSSPEELLVDEHAQALRIDKAYSWEAPLAIHGLMHSVIHNAGLKDPYGIDVLLMYMANMAWNSSMHIDNTLQKLTAKNKENDEYVIPKIIYSDAFYSEMVVYADLILPDTTYLERWDCISLLDRPISDPDCVQDAIRQPVVVPDRDVRPFQSVLLDLGARLHLPGMIDADAKPKYPGGYADYIVNHERKPGIGPLIGWRGEGQKNPECLGPNPDQLKHYIEAGCFYSYRLDKHMRYFKHANKDYLEWAKKLGFVKSTDLIRFELYSERLQKFRLAGQGFGKNVPPKHLRHNIVRYFDPLAMWYPPFEGNHLDQQQYSFYAVSQRPMHMYHSWGSQNAWLRQITNENRLYINRERAFEYDLKDDDWVWLYSHIGRVRCQVRLMEGCHKDTLWTWNAIGKRAGTWGLDKNAPEIRRSFLLNHLISQLLPKQKDGLQYANTDPVTGQAAWYDLRVRLEKISEPHIDSCKPIFEDIAEYKKNKISILQFGKEFNER